MPPAAPNTSAATLGVLVRHLVVGLVDNPDEVEVRALNLPSGLVLELRVDPADLGKVIGRKGQTARALRTVLGAAAARDRLRVILNILED
jgi:predicted RNA-binding protein YlqC (UPF0109 family)